MWRPIEDLPANWQNLANSELPPLVTVWNEQADRLRQSGEFKTFNDKLRREIAIETGIIERLYTIDRGITRLLIEQGINEALIPHGSTDRPVKQIVSLIKDQEMAIAGLFDFVGGQRSLSAFYIKQLHQLLTQNQDSTEALNPQTGSTFQVSLIRGDWKRQPNNPLRLNGTVHEYCPPEQVASEMDRLIELHHQHRDRQIPPEIEAAWLHHRFTQIHPFQDGNGRVARCLASLVFIQAAWFPLVLTRDDRAAYIKALEDADAGNLSSLVDLFATGQKKAFLKSLSLSEQVLSEKKQSRAIIASIAEKLTQKQSVSMEEKFSKVEEFAAMLFDLALNRIQELGEEIVLAVQNVSNAQVFPVYAPVGDDRDYYHRYQVIETARQLGYFANFRQYHTWMQLVIDAGTSTILLFSFHVLGREYRGILACSACAYHRDETENNEHNISDIQALTDAPFQFSYADEEDNLKERFQQWLEDTILAGLSYWNESI